MTIVSDMRTPEVFRKFSVTPVPLTCETGLFQTPVSGTSVCETLVSQTAIYETTIFETREPESSISETPTL